MRRAVKWVDERSGAAPFLMKALRYLFPDHWSFLLGEVALYAFIDDLLSGMGLAIGYSVALSTPFVGGNLGLLLWGAPFPGDHAFESRMYIAHVLILPVVIGVLIGLHLTLVASRHHTQFLRE